jgi:diguanylate cyclase (GGDEF)-like protein
MSPPKPLALVADDEDTGRLLLSEAASAAGFQPLVFDNGADALEAALAHDVAIVLLDVEMPGMGGFDVCKRVRAAKRMSLPIVMVTGRDDKAAINLAYEAGATDFVAKPVNWSLLPHRLAYIVRNAEREAKVLTLIEAIPDALWVLSPAGELRWSQNKLATGATGLAAAVPEDRLAEVLDIVAQTAHDARPRMLTLRDAATVDSSNPQDTRGYAGALSPAGTPRSAELRFTRCEGGDVLVVRQDTSERTAAALRIERLAFFDTLTGLPNRQQCSEKASQYLDLAAAESQSVAFMYLDLNGFKRINDTFGHSVGDTVLQRVAKVLCSTLESFVQPELDLFLARLGGDEFVIIVRHTQAKSLALDIAKAVSDALDKPISYGKVEFLTALSVGVAVYPQDGTDVETLLKHADTAMYQAKLSGGAKVVVYAPVMSARIRDSVDLETRLRHALRGNGLALRYQPKFRLTDGVVVGAEALVRWFDEELGEVAPNRFIPVAEETGLIVDLGAWVIRAVSEQLACWHAAGIAVPVAINVSGKELLFADPARVIHAETTRTGIAASFIEAEITESVFVTDATAGRSSVERIRALGCRVALDDFGTGYSSLSYLTKFPPDRLKIDRSFIQNVDQSTSDAAIVKAIMSLAKSLGLLVTAEGLERKGQLLWLKKYGCDEGQGYLLAQPLSATDLEGRFLRPHAVQEEFLKHVVDK